jgi:hypothetical protein
MHDINSNPDKLDLEQLRLSKSIQDLLDRTDLNSEDIQTLLELIQNIKNNQNSQDEKYSAEISALELKLKEYLSSINNNINNINNLNSDFESRIQYVETKLANGGLNAAALENLNQTIKNEIKKAEDKLANDVVTAAENTKKELYSEITGTGKEGEFLRLRYNETAGRNEVESTPLITFSKIATSQEQVEALKLEPVGMSTVFNTWYRFSHWWGDENLNSGVHLDTRNAWSYDPNTKMIKSNRNSPVYSAFISPRKLNTWYLKLLAYGGGDGDNDGVLINVAYMKGADGHEHTIDLVRAVMGSGNGVYQDSHGMDFYWSLVYDYRLNTQFELANNTYIQPKAGGWGTQYCCFSAQRTKTNVKCYTSQIGGRVETVDPKSEINWTLPLTKPSNYSQAMYDNLKTMMENPAQMGVGAHSQNGLFTILDQKYIFDDEKIYDFYTNNIWEYDEPSRLWNSVGRCSDMFDGFVYSRYTKDLYYIDNGKAINLNNASDTVTTESLNAKIEQLSSELLVKDSETLDSSKTYTDEKVQPFENDNTALKERIQTLEGFMNDIAVDQVEFNGVEYTLVYKKDSESESESGSSTQTENTENS